MKLQSALEGVSRILLDTAPVIYLVEKSPERIGLLKEFFLVRDERNIALVTTPITLAECVTHPQRLGREDLVSTYRSMVLDGPGTRFLSLGAEDAVKAAKLRAEYNLSLTDAFQVAVALRSGCQAILTNDRRFGRVTDVRAIVVDELEP